MLITTLIFLPLIIATIWTTKRSIEEEKWETTIIVPVFAFILFFHVIAVTEYWYYGLHGWTAIRSLDCWLYPFILPLVYILLCFKTGQKDAIINVLTMLVFALTNMTSGITINLPDDSTVKPVDIFYFTVIWNNIKIIEIPINECVIAIQAIWLVIRLYNYKSIMNKEGTHLSKEVKKMFWYILLVAIVSVCNSVLPNSMFDKNPMIFLITHIPISVISAHIVYSIGKGYFLTPIIDENDEQALSTISDSKEKIFRKIDEYIRKGNRFLEKDIQVADIAKAVKTNRTYITQAIQESTGDNLNTYINSLRIEEAKKIIKERPAIKMEEVAEMCGFGSASSFTKIFKKHTGSTPSELRTKIRKTSAAGKLR